MAKLLASSQITIVDLNDAVSLQSYITSTHPRMQFLNNNGTYIPNYKSENVTLNAELYKMGNGTNLVTNPGVEVSKVTWFVKVGPTLEYTEITPDMDEYELIGTVPIYRGLKIKDNIMNASKPGATFKSEIVFKEAWMEDPHIQITEIDFGLTLQGNDGLDSYTAIITNENHSILCSNSGVPDVDEIGKAGRAFSDTLAFKGTQILQAVNSNPGIGQFSITVLGENCEVVKSDSDTFYINSIPTISTAMISEDGIIEEDKATSNILDSNLNAKNIANGGRVKVSFNMEGLSTIVKYMTWSKVLHGANGMNGENGADGEAAKYIILSLQEGSNVFKYEKNSSTPNISRVVLQATTFNISNPTYTWSYFASGSWITINGQSNSTLTVNHNDSYFNASNSVTFRCTTNNNLTDEITISKLIDGSDSISIQSSNESHVIACTYDGNFKPGESEKAVNTIIAYKGINALTYTTGTPGEGQYKITVDQNDDVDFTLINNTIKILDMDIDSSILTIKVNCEGEIYTKFMSLSKAKEGVPAKALQITGGSTVIFKQDGTKDPASGVILTAVKKNTTGTVVWKYGSTQLATGDTYTVPVNVLNSTTSYTVRAEISGETSIYDTHTIHKIIDGTNAITSYLWCPNGNAIKNNSMTEVTIEAVIFDGGSNVSNNADAKYHWQKKVGSNWVDIKGTSSSPVLGNNNGSIISISQDDIPSMLVVRCNMKYQSTNQTDTIVIEDIVDPVQATIYSTAGDTFKNSIGETFLIAKAIRNGEEIDYIRLVDSITGITGSQGELVFSKLDKKYYKYNNSSWTSVGTINEPPTTDFVFDYNWTKSDKDGNLISNWSKTGKILYVQSNEVSQKDIFMVDVEE